MNIGTLDRRLHLQLLQAGQDSAGQPVPTWTTVATVWATVQYLSGVQTIKSDADTSISKASVRVRHRSDLSAGMRLIDAAGGADVFDVKAVLPAKRKGYTDLVCEVVQ
jgi:SPP1 family predicted phage head-tail adaptor